MALELLYGPVTCTLDPDDSTISGTAVHTDKDAFWFDDHGWVVGGSPSGISGAGLSPIFIINIDGVYILRKNQPSVFGYGDFNYDYLTGKGMCLVGTTLVVLEPDTGVFYADGQSSLRNTTTVAQIRTPEGYYRVSGSNVQRAPLSATSDSDYVTEFTLTGAPTFSAPSTVSPGPESTIFFCYTDGTIIQYDYLAKTELAVNPSRAFGGDNRRVLGITPRRCVYSLKLGVFMVLDGDGITADTISIYADEFVIDNLTAPTADPAITAGAISTISVTLRDAGNRGIRNRRVDWSITAGNGTLLDTQTTTDEDGVATTQYRAPITGGVNPTIQASVTY